MALTEQQLRKPTTDSVPTQGRISRAWSLVLAGAWALLFPIALALEPAAAADAATPWWGEIMAFGLLGAIIASLVGLTRRMRWGVGMSFVASTIFATGVFLCPATGHHAFGLWWIGEFAASLALVSLSTVAYFRTR
jgi:hypothetical protein